MKKLPVIDQLVVVSNRLPLSITPNEGAWSVQPGSGGLVTALAPVLRDRNGIWCGWSGTTIEDEAPIDDLLEGQETAIGYRLMPVLLSRDELRNFYFGFANETIWPLFHDLLGRTRFEKQYWESYLTANQRYADVLSAKLSPNNVLWVHDYHLIHLGSMLREKGFLEKIGFFLHIPFPPLDLFKRLPWRKELLEKFLAYDLVGFQTRRDYSNFMHCVRELLPSLQVTSVAQTSKIIRQGACTLCQSFPISIDFNEFYLLSLDPTVKIEANQFHDQYPDQKIVLGIDRLDYTKGIVPRFRSFHLFLRNHPEFHGKIVLFQVVIPSRIEVPEYQAMKKELEQLLAQINGEFSRPGWVPIHYLYRHLSRRDLIAIYRASDIALVTPIKDGMNLVCKEYCASSPNEGVLILSEFAGAADQLKQGAILVNPYDLDGVAEAIYKACTMPREEQISRLNSLRNHLRRNNVFTWVEHFLKTLSETEKRDIGHAGPG